jgi:hypothetical protein
MYAHLAPGNKLQAVKVLDRERLNGNPIHTPEADLTSMAAN